MISKRLHNQMNIQAHSTCCEFIGMNEAMERPTRPMSDDKVSTAYEFMQKYPQPLQVRQ